MNVPCPRGSSCPGSTPLAIQECFLSSTSRRMPRVARERRERSGLEVGLETFVEGVTSTRYDTYQCAACGAQVVFSRSSIGVRRIWDSLHGPQL
jgi:hypothetical protein